MHKLISRLKIFKTHAAPASVFSRIKFAGFFAFVLTAYFSEGFFHPDEHFQILEFCNYKMGLSPAEDLPWEFKEKIRPALQPALCMAFVKLFHAVGIQSAFNCILWIRILTAVLAWILFNRFGSFLLPDFKTERGKILFMYIANLTWFTPLISVRFSSENYSALSFLCALFLILKSSGPDFRQNIKSLFAAGFLLGISFFFRFQIGLAIAGLGFWLLFVNKGSLKNWIPIIFGAGLASVICIGIDSWFYETFTLTPVRYFQVNILENKAANWGTQPWWNYLPLFALKAIPPISLLLLLGFFSGPLVKSKHLFFWCILPFLLGHFAIGHKEMRFLFPMSFCFLYLSALGIEDLLSKENWRWPLRFLINFSILVNFILLPVIMFSPAQIPVKVFRFLSEYSKSHETVLLCKEKNIYDLVGLNANFYKSTKLKCIVLEDNEDIANYLKRNKPDSVFLLERQFIPDYNLAGYTMSTIYRPLPDWIIYFNLNNWLSRSRIWEIKKLKSENTRAN